MPPLPPPGPELQLNLLTLFFKEAGLESKFSVLGKGMLSISGLFVPAAKEMVEMLYEFEKPFVVEANRFLRPWLGTASSFRPGSSESPPTRQENCEP